MLPLFCIMALDLLMCLVTRAVLDETTHPEGGEEEEEEGEGEGEGGSKTPQASEQKPGEGPSSTATQKEKEEEEKEESSPKTKSGADSEGQAFYSKFGERLIHILFKVTDKLLKFSHLYAVSSSNANLPPFTPQCSDIPLQALHVFLGLSGKQPIPQAKDWRALFGPHIPEGVRERLKHWKAALPIDSTHKQKLFISLPEVKIDVCMLMFLEHHFTAFCGVRTFDPARSLKSCLTSVVTLTSMLLSLKPAGGGGGTVQQWGLGGLHVRVCVCVCVLVLL